MGKKKEKITYVDDGRTVADMSGVSGGFGGGKRSEWMPRSSLKERWDTYWSAVKMMFLPMLVVVAALCGAFLILYLVL